MFGIDEISNILMRRKLRLFMIIIIIGFSILLIRLGYLQIICSRYYVKRSKENSIRPIRLIPPRGVLYDRYGKESIVDNETAFDVCIAPSKADFITGDVQYMDSWRREALRRLNLTPGDIKDKLKAVPVDTIEPVVIAEDVDKANLVYLAENRSHIQEIIIRARPKRRYRQIAPHIVGYTACADENDLENGYEMNDVLGKAGIEAKYEESLKGQLGWKMVEVNAFGQVVRDLPLAVYADPGRNLNLSLDAAVQRTAEALLEGRAGAIVAIEPRSGEILAMASKPDFDPNYLKRDWDQLRNRPDDPLLNRAITGEYPPGSTFKIVTATTALEEKKIDESVSYYCNGRFQLGRWTFRCHKPSGHGSMRIHEAIVQSCNVFFYNVAYHRGVNVSLMHKYALMYGMGKPTGVDLPGERGGFIPEEGKYAGDSVNMAIGQGRTLVTPMQMANLMCVIANRGFSYRPHIVKRDQEPEIFIDLRGKVSPGTIDIIRNALKEVPERGACRLTSLPKYHSAGKTGTAQNPHGDEHAWFIGFAPFENPQIAIAVVVENAGRGSLAAAPIAGQVFDAYFNKSQQPILASLQKGTSLTLETEH